MPNRVSFLASALMPAYTTAVAFYPLLRLAGWHRRVAFIALGLPILLLPCLLPASAYSFRYVAALSACFVVLKTYDLLVCTTTGASPRLGAYLRYLFNPFAFVLRKLGEEPRPSVRENVLRLCRLLPVLALAVAVCVAVFRIDWRPWPLLLEHVVKMVAFYFAFVPATALAVVLWRLPGWPARDYMASPFLAATPAEFWRQYNRPIHQFLHENVYLSFKARFSPKQATLLTFAVSAVIHEYLIGIVLGYFQGYWTLFFALHGAATACTSRLQLAGWKKGLGILTTQIFNLLTFALFFGSLQEVLRFYARR